MRRLVVLGVLLVGAGCTPFDQLGEAAKCRLRGCDAGVDAGDSGSAQDSDAGQVRVGCDRPDLRNYSQRAAAEWDCVTEALRWSADGGFGMAAPPFLVPIMQPTAQGYASGLLLPDGRVLGVPLLEQRLLFVNPDNRFAFKPFTASAALNYDGGGRLRSPVGAGVLASDGVVYLCPAEDPVFVSLEIPFDGGLADDNELPSSVRRLPPDAAVLGDGGLLGWSGCVSAPGLGVFAVPRFGRFLLGLPLDGGAVRAIDLTSVSGAVPAPSGTTDEFFGAQLARTGEIVAIPFGPGASRFVAYEPTGLGRVRYLTVEPLPLLPGSGATAFLRGSVILGDGTIVAVPSTTVMPVGVSVDTSLVRVQLPDGGGALSRPAFGGVVVDERLFVTSFSFLDPPMGVVGGLDVWNTRTGRFSAATLPSDLDVSGFGGAVARPDGTIVFIPRKDQNLVIFPTGTNRPLPLETRLSPFLNHL
jgi:hypothetical protein